MASCQTTNNYFKLLSLKRKIDQRAWMSSMNWEFRNTSILVDNFQYFENTRINSRSVKLDQHRCQSVSPLGCSNEISNCIVLAYSFNSKEIENMRVAQLLENETYAKCRNSI